MLGPALTLAAYLVGSISFGLLLTSRQGVDLRGIGSGNIGATNVGRALGKSTGRKVMLLDMLKGFVPVALARWTFDLPWPWITAVGIAATLGHVFPIWHAFRGGKGAATAGGVLLGALPPIGVATLLTFVLVKKFSRRASVASLSAATLAVALTIGIDGRQWPIQLAVGLWIIVLIRHAGNIARLLQGEEPPG
ncbi:MAG: glycerol-3-phosphate 1-O-acyltransferase PlsY [Deltaproteobacteria bacterium]